MPLPNEHTLNDPRGNIVRLADAGTEMGKMNGEGSRLASLDFYRGLVMVLLMLGASGLYDHITGMTRPGTFSHALAIQFEHHPWHGLRFWDLIQPAFMFIAGTAMAFSITKQTGKGLSWKKQAERALRRSWWLFFWGVLDYAVKGNSLSFELWDVLTQMSFTLLLAFLLFRYRPAYQILFSIGLLVLTVYLYQFTSVPGFDQPFTNQHNFGNYIDLVLMNKINPRGWVAINCIPTAAHTIWGAVAGKWLLSPTNTKTKIRRIIILGVLLLLVGYLLDLTGIIPIIKHIATPSFTLVSGGWCLLGLSFFYFWIDVLKHKKWLRFFTVVGMNSIFIYLFFEIVGGRWFNAYINTIVTNLASPFRMLSPVALILSSVVIFMLEWYLCLWLFRKKIFFKI